MVTAVVALIQSKIRCDGVVLGHVCVRHAPTTISIRMLVCQHARIQLAVLRVHATQTFLAHNSSLVGMATHARSLKSTLHQSVDQVAVVHCALIPICAPVQLKFVLALSLANQLVARRIANHTKTLKCSIRLQRCATRQVVSCVRLVCNAIRLASASSTRPNQLRLQRLLQRLLLQLSRCQPMRQRLLQLSHRLRHLRQSRQPNQPLRQLHRRRHHQRRHHHRRRRR